LYSKIKKELKQLYQEPQPKRKEEFLKEFMYPKMTPLEAVITQISYIHKYIWILSVFLVFGIVILTKFFLWKSTTYDLLYSLSAVMPILAVLVITETFRSSVYGMAELEMTTKYNLPQIILIRMGAIGMTDLCLIVSTIPFVIQQGTIGFMQVAIYLMVPYLCTCVLMLQIEKRERGKEATWYGILCGFFLFGLNILTKGIQEIIYNNHTFYIWLIVFIVFVGILVKQIWSILHKMEEWKWSLSLTK